MSGIVASTINPEETTEKFYRKYYQDLTDAVVDVDIEHIDVKFVKNDKRVFQPECKIDENSYNMFYEQRYGYTGKRNLRKSFILKPQFLEVERFSFGILGIISFLLLIISIGIGNYNLLVAASSVFIAVWSGIIIAYLVSRTVANN
jgi:hypothetical protein